jgi:serpin B
MKKLISIFLVLIFAINICSCSNAEEYAYPKESVSSEEPPVYFVRRPALAATNDGTINLTKNISSDSVIDKDIDNAFINSQANFAVDLFKKTVKRDKNKNVLISPLSVQLVLTMAFNGAVGETKKEFEQLMDGITVEELNKYLYSYLNSLNNNQFDISNSIWIKNGFDVNKDFLKINKNYYNTDVFSADFNSETVKDINNWASDKTEGMIKELLSDDALDEFSVMCLVNALLLDANWEYTYNGSDETQEFTNIAGEKKKVQTLGSGALTIYNDSKATGFKKELEGNQFSFVALLPNKNIHINDYINGLTGEKLLDVLNNHRNDLTYTQMPEFNYEYTAPKIKESLHSLGIKLAFDPDNANFSKIASDTAIDQFVHKTKISVNEVGVKAAAASAAVVLHNGIAKYDSQIIIDRPFVYMIIDNKTNLPIFMGAVMDV